MAAELTRLLMRICAARLDPTVSGQQFVDLIEQLVDATTVAGTVVEGRPLPVEIVPAKPNGHDHDPPPYTTPSVQKPPRRRWKRPDRSKIDYDERVRIRSRAEAEKGEAQQFPAGFIPGLAAEYNVSEQTIRNILKGD